MYKYNITLTIRGELFLFSSKLLSRQDKIALESFCASAKDDYENELEDLDTYDLCQWVQAKIKEELGITLNSEGIDLELNLDV